MTHQPVKVGGFVFFIIDFELIIMYTHPHWPVKVGGVFLCTLNRKNGYIFMKIWA